MARALRRVTLADAIGRTGAQADRVVEAVDALKRAHERHEAGPTPETWSALSGAEQRYWREVSGLVDWHKVVEEQVGDAWDQLVRGEPVQGGGA